MSTRIIPQPATRMDLPESEQPAKQIVIYICPTPECPNFYGAPTFRPDRSDIESMQHHRSQNDGQRVESHPRIECPDCRIRDDKHVNRIPYVVTAVVSLEEMRKAVVSAAKKVEAANAKSG